MIATKSQIKKINQRYFIQLAAFLGLVGFMISVVLLVENMLLSCVLAFVIYFLFNPIVNALERRGGSRTTSICILFLVGGLLISFGVTIVYPLISTQLISLKSELPKYIEGTTKLIQRTEEQLVFLSELFSNFDLTEQTEEVLTRWTKDLFDDLPLFLSRSLTVTLLAPFLAFFMLKDGPRLSKKLFAMVPNNLFELALNLRHQISDQLGSFIRARLLEAILVGTVVWFGLWAISFPYATILAIFAALANLIPYLGPFIGAIPALVVALVNGGSAFSVFLVMLPYIIAQVIDVFLIIPIVVAKIVNLHPVTVIVSFIIGAELMGILGMIIAIPVASVIKVTLLNIYLHLVEFRA